MSGKYILDEAGTPVPCNDIHAWGKWFGESDRRTVALEEIPGLGSVSTVFLGLDHSFGGGAPILYETLVFGGPLEDTMERYRTRDEALAGHAAMVKRVRDSREWALVNREMIAAVVLACDDPTTIKKIAELVGYEVTP